MRQQEGGMSLLSTPPSPPSILHHTVPISMAAPAHQSEESGELAKVVNGKPEHVIGAHPRIVNVLQDETLMETHDGVVVCF